MTGRDPNPNQRHPAVQDAMRWLVPNPNLPGHLRDVSVSYYNLGMEMLTRLDDSPQLTMALHKLVESKDCAVRARLAME